MHANESFATALRDARSAVTAADYDRAEALLATCEDWPDPYAEAGSLAKAEVLLHRHPVSAVAYLAAIAGGIHGDAGRFAYNLLSARAFASVRNAPTALARLDAAEAFVDAVVDGHAQLALYRVRFRWYANAATLDDPDLAVALTDSDPNGRALALLQRSWLHAACEDFTGQLRDLRAALTVVDDAAAPPNVKARAMIVFVLARLAFECADADAIAHAQSAFDRLAWTDAVIVERYQALRAFGWDAFMRGHAARAQWIFREARGIAPSDAWRALSHLDRAYVARIEGNEAWALDELFEADAVAQRIAWAQTANEERMVLVTFAEMFAPVDTARAQWYAATYTAMGLDGVSPNLVASRERRNAADERYMFGVIERTIGNRAAATEALTEAFALFHAIDHHWKAALAASALAEVTGDGAWTRRAVEHIARYPGSPLAAQIARPAATQADERFDRLTPMQRQVARGMIEGLDARKLSARFSRSSYTIEREMRVVFETFGTDRLASIRDIALKAARA
jgi:hypothetical protein